MTRPIQIKLVHFSLYFIVHLQMLKPHTAPLIKIDYNFIDYITTISFMRVSQLESWVIYEDCKESVRS